jgi:ABC-type glycerol-3-phosphate transport system substrate-binding protein
MAKKILISTLVMLALAGAAFASGQKEPVQSPAQAAPLTAAPTVEKLSLTGTLSLEDSWHPILKAAGKEYELMVPRYLTWNLDVKEGEQVSVEGYVVQGMPWRAQSNDGDIDLMVTRATIKGEDYDLSQYRGQARGVMMGSRSEGCDGCRAPGPRGSTGSGWNRGGGRGRGEMRPGWGRGFQS